MSTRRHQTTVAIEYDSERMARAIERSLREEVGEIADDRSVARLERDGRRLTLALAADDLVALRAAANTWLALADVAEQMAGVAASWSA